MQVHAHGEHPDADPRICDQRICGLRICRGESSRRYPMMHPGTIMSQLQPAGTSMSLSAPLTAPLSRPNHICTAVRGPLYTGLLIVLISAGVLQRPDFGAIGS